MFKKAIEHFTTKKETKLKSFDLLRLQAKSYRILKKVSEQVLQKKGLTVIDWSLLGILYKNPKGIRLSAIAEKLGVDPPFVTEIIGKLLNNKLISSESDQADGRAKLLRLTKKGESQVMINEDLITRNILKSFSGIDLRDFNGFQRTIRLLSEEKE